MTKDNSNEDIRVVYDDKLATVATKKLKGITSTDFKNAMGSTGTVIMLEPNQSEFNRSQLILRQGVYPPYGFTLNQGDDQILGLATQISDLQSASRTSSHERKIRDFLQD